MIRFDAKLSLSACIGGLSAQYTRVRGADLITLLKELGYIVGSRCTVPSL